MKEYHPELYWNEVGKRISARDDNNIIAGDDEPYYRYKREKFLKILHSIEFQSKIVLEVGSGPGGNLYEIAKQQPTEIHGVDISEVMVTISQELLSGQNIKIQKIDGEHIPYADQYFDLCFTSTVLQHITNENMLLKLAEEICRVTKRDIYLFERIERSIKGNALNLGRPVEYYKEVFETFGFKLYQANFLNIQVSYLLSGIIRKLFNKKNRKEGEPESKISKSLQKIILPLTSRLDQVIKTKRDLAMLHFKSKQLPY